MSLKDTVKKIGLLVVIFQWWKASSYFFRFRPIQFIRAYSWYWRDYVSLKKFERNSNFPMELKNIHPCVVDKLSYTPLDPVYFYQDSWGAKKIFELKPSHHYDVGSAAKTIGIISQFVPTTMIDIRPIDLKMEGLNFIQGSILDLPFKDNSIESISSLCVVEHIGLGRYGDPLDTQGSEKAIKELKRVVKIGGSILFSVPVDDKNKVYFNAHRAFERDYIVGLFDNCELVEEKYIYKKEMTTNYAPERGFGIGLYMFRKIK